MRRCPGEDIENHLISRGRRRDTHLRTLLEPRLSEQIQTGAKPTKVSMPRVRDSKSISVKGWGIEGEVM